jgi:hypothetical protein
VAGGEHQAEEDAVRIHLMSDLHVDIQHNGDFEIPEIDRDVLIVAGDVCQPASYALRWLRDQVPVGRIIYVPGNHDFYSDGSPKAPPDMKVTWEGERENAARLAQDLGIDLLDDAVSEIAGTRVVGATLWTDFSHRPGLMPIGEAIREAEGRDGMTDYRTIKTGRGRSKDRLRARQTIEAHMRSRAFLESALATPFDGPTVVVTHHAPLPSSEFRSLEFCYRTDLRKMMSGDQAPELWIHGHTHGNTDLLVGDTRVICNPRGYPTFPRKGAPRENPAFVSDLVVEVAPRPVNAFEI